MTELVLAGELVEIGRLENESGSDGILIRRSDQSFVTVKGLEMDEVRGLAPLFFEDVQIVITEVKATDPMTAAAPDMLQLLRDAYSVIATQVADGESTLIAARIRELVAKVIA